MSHLAKSKYWFVFYMYVFYSFTIFDCKRIIFFLNNIWNSWETRASGTKLVVNSGLKLKLLETFRCGTTRASWLRLDNANRKLQFSSLRAAPGFYGQVAWAAVHVRAGTGLRCQVQAFLWSVSGLLISQVLIKCRLSCLVRLKYSK